MHQPVVRRAPLRLLFAAAALCASVVLAPVVAAAPTVSANPAVTSPAAPLADTGDPVNHHFDVAIMSPAGMQLGTGFIHEQDARTLVTQAGAYWRTQTYGRISGFTTNKVVALWSAHKCTDVGGLWADAAKRFGHTKSWYWEGSGRHLLVFVQGGCGMGTGYGTVGANDKGGTPSLTNGGLIRLISYPQYNLANLSHEFGHNLGLQHSDAQHCSSTAVSEGSYNTSNGAIGNGCTDKSYGDLIDVMSFARMSDGYINPHPAALSASQKARLGLYRSGELASYVLPEGQARVARTINVASTGTVGTAASKAIRITDPNNGRQYFVEFRAGDGYDSPTIYGQGRDWSLGAGKGVRILALRPNGHSVVMTPPAAHGPEYQRQYFNPGEQFTSSTGAIHIRYNGVVGGRASVSFTIDAKKLTVGAPNLQGNAQVGVALTANPGAWTAGTNLQYQWLRNGKAIAGATKRTYTVAAADAGTSIQSRVVGKKAGYTTAAKVTAAKKAFGVLSAPTPTIVGSVVAGQNLSAVTGSWNPAPTVAYQWLRNGKPITGATKTVYTVVSADVGQKISVKVTGTKTGWVTLAKASGQVVVKVQAPLPTPSPSATPVALSPRA